ncbi:MAG: prepilin-type N-terminal cleavage/methylation domain-containing protein, partial [Candidatus Saccharimonadales bacterium]
MVELLIRLACFFVRSGLGVGPVDILALFFVWQVNICLVMVAVIKCYKMKTNKSSPGFTIVELLVVIAIIAVLAAIVLVNVTSYVAKSKRSSVEG